MNNALQAAACAPWAMPADELNNLLGIAGRESEATPEALEAYRAQRLKGADAMTVRDGVAVLPIIGPMFRRANLFMEVSGGASYDVMRRDLAVAAADPGVRAIILNIDSPGGEMFGCQEFADAVRDARAEKEVVAYCGGNCQSGGYWIASAATRVVGAESGVYGSIGVVQAVFDTTARDERSGVFKRDIVSSVSPNKRPDVTTDEGRAVIQTLVDELGEVFVAAVAQNRGIGADKVIADFGKGGSMAGPRALAVGMIDSIGSFEGVMAELAGGQTRSPRTPRRSVMGNENETETVAKADHDAAVAKASADGEAKGAAAERDRLSAITSHADIAGNGARVTAATDLAAKSPGMSAEDVVSFVSANVSATPAAPPASAPGANSAPAAALGKRGETPDSLAAAGHAAAGGGDGDGEPKKSGLQALAEKRHGAPKA